MSFTNDDILTLARAGFTATQISALNSIQTPVQPIQPVVQPMQTPVQPMQPVTDQYGDTLNQILSAIQTNAINQTTQPKVQTTDEILAEIINPTIREEK
jgi:hypothetical protein